MNAFADDTSRDPRVGFFDRHAAMWDADIETHRKTLQKFIEMKSGLGIEAGMDLLEVGCGTGQLTELLASWVRPGRVTGVDFSPCMLERARAKCPNADFKLLDICNEPPALAQFDVVLCFQSFPHFRDKTAALGNIARALKPGGRLIILHFASSAQIGALHASMGDAVACDMLPPPPMWPKWLGAAGLQLESYTDREGLFLLVARRPCCGKGGSASGTESCSDPKLHNPHLKGFTLVELLVVISILGILAGLGFPGFAKAREKAKVTKVHAELYGIGLALQMYSDDHLGRVPPVRVNCNSDLFEHWCQLPVELSEQRYLPRSTKPGREANLEDPFVPGHTYKYAAPGPQLLNGQPAGNYELWVPEGFPLLDGTNGTYYGDPATSPVKWAVWSLGPRWPSAKSQSSRAPVSSLTWYKRCGDSGVIVRFADRDGVQLSSP